jgi:hypothetical protein
MNVPKSIVGFATVINQRKKQPELLPGVVGYWLVENYNNGVHGISTNVHLIN